MSKRKGVSADEKRSRLLDLFYEKKEFFQLKELEKIAPKEKGIIAQSVKEVLQALVDDGLVDSDKIGTSIYFWSFPSKSMSIKKRKLDTITTDLEQCKLKLLVVEEKLLEEKAKRNDTEEHENAIKKLSDLQNAKTELLKEVGRYAHCDPEYLTQLEQKTLVIKNAANRWTENVFAAKSWCVNKTQIDENTFNKHFGIPEEFDYVDIDD